MANPDFDMSTLGEDAQEYIRELRREAAKYRTERNDFRQKFEDSGEALREANAKFDEFKTLQGDHERTLSENSTLQERLGRMKAAGEAGIFSEYERLKGSKEEEWVEDAKSLAEKFGTKKPSGLPKDPAGEGGTPPPRDGDALQKAFEKAGFQF